MKYIRTEDGKIYDKGKIICSAFREEYCSPNWNEDIEKYLQTKIVAEADTIEELCDEFTVVYENCKPLVFDINEFMRYRDEYLKRKLIYGTEIYFSIWVGNDLHSVAKTNDKGELELL